MKQRLIAIGAAAAAVLVLAACSSNKTTSPGSMSSMPMTRSSGAATSGASATTAAGAHNQSDVTFATDMIPHHRQAVQMADMALNKATNAGVKALALAIKDAQDPEITQMSGWLTGWRQPVPSASNSGMGGMSGMEQSGVGMMSDADMTSLSKATGAIFDRMWTSMMIDHHKGALTMARTEQKLGESPDAKALAQTIITGQSAQLTQLTVLLARLPK